MDSENKRSILEMARGAFQERVDSEMAKVIDNILDESTIANKKRKISVTLEFIPDNDRSNISVEFSVKSTLAPIAPAATSLYISGAPESGEVRVVEKLPQIPGQLGIDGKEMGGPVTLKIKKRS